MKKNYNLCVVGAGRWGKNHVKTLFELNALGGVVDDNKVALEEIKSQYPSCDIFDNLNDSFKNNFDGYIVSTPPQTHFEIVEKIIHHGKSVLVEKPITLSLENAIKLNKLAKKNNINLMVGHLLLFHPAFIKIKNLIDDGSLGKIQYIYSNRLNLGNFRSDENVLWSFAPHDISLFNYFFDEIPIEVSSNGVDILQEGIHDSSITSLKYKENKMGHIFVSWLHPFKEHRFVVIGSKGMVRFEDVGENKPLTFYNKSVDMSGKIPAAMSGSSYNIDYGNELPLKSELKYFISKINCGKIKKADGDSAVEVMRILERATNSLMKDY
jgi:UDP-2-acetamido-3-amino-2,3-dideoxy-glucuronate N-acetyltransferase